jgi:heme exporter protein C
LFSIFTITILYVFLLRKGAQIEKMREVIKKAKSNVINRIAS